MDAHPDDPDAGPSEVGLDVEFVQAVGAGRPSGYSLHIQRRRRAVLQCRLCANAKMNQKSAVFYTSPPTAGSAPAAARPACSGSTLWTHISQRLVDSVLLILPRSCATASALAVHVSWTLNNSSQAQDETSSLTSDGSGGKHLLVLGQHWQRIQRRPHGPH